MQVKQLLYLLITDRILMGCHPDKTDSPIAGPQTFTPEQIFKKGIRENARPALSGRTKTFGCK